MTFFDLFRRKPREETRAAGMGFTADLMAAREAYISGRSGVADLTATAQACVSLWEGGLGIADVDGTDLLNRRSMGLMGRALALRGEAVFLIREDGLIPANDWDVRTRNGIPRAYRLTISEAGGGNSETVLAAEVLHIRIGSDAATPWHGTAPLRRARLTAGLLQSVETALAEVYDNAPLGSQIVPYPEGQETDMAALGRGFRGRRGQVLMRESVHVTAAGGPTPQTDWRPSDVTPDISKAMTKESLESARDAVAAAFGVLPGMFYRAATGPVIREAQRHLVQWTLEPIAALIAEEASEKLGSPVNLDVARSLQAFDTGGRARALGAIVKAAAEAKAAGVSDDFAKALALVDWKSE